MNPHINIVLILTFGFALASLLGYFAKRLRLPTMLGFLLAGYLIGPHSPGFVADITVAEELAEIGVILMLFSVGLHFDLKDLYRVKKIAISGALLQTAVAVAVTVLITHLLHWSIQGGVILGLAIGVASTFVMARVLSDFHLLDTLEGHIAVGWLVVEDIFTVLVLMILPILGLSNHLQQYASSEIIFSILVALGKLLFLCFILFTVGAKWIKYILTKIAKTRSQELFTITILAIVLLIATTSSVIFGASLALGAFISGMVIGMTNIKYQAAANSLSLKDTFTIIFFLSVGMLLDPYAIPNNWGLFLGVIAIILLVKPITAFALSLCFRLSFKVALTIAFALAQIGEFSFILAELATQLNLLPSIGYDVIVCSAFISISLNPLLFYGLGFFERVLKKVFKKSREDSIANNLGLGPKAIVIGYGPIGEEAAKILRQRLYMETTRYVIESARKLNPSIKIFVRVRYLLDIPEMEELKVHYICSEKEVFQAFQEALQTLK